jgi:hypothetical protein
MVLAGVAHEATLTSAQQPAAPPPPPAGRTTSNNPVPIPLRVQVVVSRWQGEKRISNLPYVLSVNAVDVAPPFDLRAAPTSQIRMGAKVPVPSATPPMVDGKPFAGPGVLTSATPVSYQDIGTSIDCRARLLDGGLFEVGLSIDDTSIYTNEQSQSGSPIVAEMPVFRSFRSSNMLILRDGQTSQFTAATDRVSGEVTRVDVTLTVVK